MPAALLPPDDGMTDELAGVLEKKVDAADRMGPVVLGEIALVRTREGGFEQFPDARGKRGFQLRGGKAPDGGYVPPVPFSDLVSFAPAK